MEPLLSVSTYVDVGVRRYGRRFASIPINKEARRFPDSSIFSQIFWCAVLVFYCCTAWATTGIAVITPDAIYITFDSNMTYIGTPVKDAPRKVCKIVQAGKYFFAAAAIASESATAFDLRATVISGMDKATGNPAERVASFHTFFRPILENLVRSFQRDFPVSYSTMIGVDIIQGVFATAENGRLALIQSVWSLKPDGTIRDVQDVIGGDANTVLMGSYDVAKAYLDAHPTTLPIEESLKLPIQAQIDSMSRMENPLVGPPIVSLKISRNGIASWHGQGNRPDIEN